MKSKGPSLIVWIVVLLMSAAAEVRQASNIGEQIGISERIQNGDLKAVNDAGSSGNRAFIPYLRADLMNPKYSTLRGDLQIALASSPLSFERQFVREIDECGGLGRILCCESDRRGETDDELMI